MNQNWQIFQLFRQITTGKIYQLFRQITTGKICVYQLERAIIFQHEEITCFHCTAGLCIDSLKVLFMYLSSFKT